MQRKRFNRDYHEINRTTRVKLYKSGKKWIRSVMSNIGLLKIFKGSEEEIVISAEQHVEVGSETNGLKLFTGISTLGLIAGGGLILDQGRAYADDSQNLVNQKEIGETNTLIGTDKVRLTEKSVEKKILIKIM